MNRRTAVFNCNNCKTFKLYLHEKSIYQPRILPGLNPVLIAPCGMNCGTCLGYLREKNKCVGCRLKSDIKITQPGKLRDPELPPPGRN